MPAGFDSNALEAHLFIFNSRIVAPQCDPPQDTFLGSNLA